MEIENNANWRIRECGFPHSFFFCFAAPWARSRSVFRISALCPKISDKICAKLPIDFFLKLCYTIIRGWGKHQEAPRARQKTIIKCNGCSLVERIPRVCHLTRSSRVLPIVVCAFGWVGKGMMCVRAAPQTKIFKKISKKLLTNQSKCGIMIIENKEKR